MWPTCVYPANTVSGHTYNETARERERENLTLTAQVCVCTTKPLSHSLTQTHTHIRMGVLSLRHPFWGRFGKMNDQHWDESFKNISHPHAETLHFLYKNVPPASLSLSVRMCDLKPHIVRHWFYRFEVHFSRSRSLLFFFSLFHLRQFIRI